MKICSRCTINKPTNEFYKDPRYGTPRSWCKKCCNQNSHDWNKSNPKKHIIATKKWKGKNGRKTINARLVRTYGITIDKYDHMFSEQNGLCAICGTDNPKGRGKFHVDHAHSTGKIRGLLCNNCNTLLGFCCDHKSTLQSAIDYLDYH